MLKKFIQEESGATAIEYGLIAGLVSVAIVLVLTSIGDNLNLVYGEIDTTLAGAVSS